MTSSTRPAFAVHLVGGLAAATFLFHLVTAPGYGVFRDELYYVACGEHLGWGYVDQPPMIGWIAAAVTSTLGTSLYALRALPALCAALVVLLTGATARRLGGGRFAQGLAAILAFLSPVALSLASIFSMNAFDLVAWAAAWWLLVRLLDGADPRLWLAFGAVCGLGLLNKVSVLFLGFGLVVGLVLGRRFDVFRSPWLWAGGALAGLLFLPHVLWQVASDWPTLEFMDNATRTKNLALSPGTFLAEQVLQQNPLALPVWLGGLVWLLAGRDAKPFRSLGWAYLAILAVMLQAAAKPYYLAPAYPVLFAAGGVAVERFSGALTRTPRTVLRAAVAGLVVVGGVLVAPLAKPLLPVDTFVRYADALGVAPSTAERHELARLPQFYADMHGWEELAEAVAEVASRLPEAERGKLCIFGQNYGQAGAVDFFGPDLGLPTAISAHNSYYLWGPGDCTGEVMIILGDDRERLEELFEEVELGAVFECQDCMPYENHKSIWVVHRLRIPVADLWPEIKRFT